MWELPSCLATALTLQLMLVETATTQHQILVPDSVMMSSILIRIGTEHGEEPPVAR
jgi:hypothetical protein